MDDSTMYTGNDGIFENEFKDDKTKELLQIEQQRIQELTPKLESIIEMIDNEKAITMEFIAGYVDSNKDDDDTFRIELKSAGRYRRYLDELKTKFVLTLNEVKK